MTDDKHTREGLPVITRDVVDVFYTWLRQF